MAAWHEDDKFWDDTAPVVFNEERCGQAPAQVEQILAMTKVLPGASVLDLACGPGRHALEFSRRGYKVTGVDRTAKYLEIAHDKAQQQGQRVEWVHADMRKFHRPGVFDLVVNLLTSFGYFDDAADDHRVAENFFACLKPGGHLVIDLMGKEVLARIFRSHDWHKEPDGTMVLEERKVSGDWSWIDVRWIIIRDKKTIEHRFGHRLYAASELKELLASVGFVEPRAYGSLEGTPYDHEAERLVVVAQRPAG